MDVHDEERYRSFVEARSAALLRTAYLLVGDRDGAEDLLQAALTKTYLAWARIRDPEAVEAYVRRIMVTTLTSWRRRRWYSERLTDDMGDGPIGPDPTAAHADRDEVWCLLRGLPPKQRAVLVLRYFEDLSETQVADALGISRGTVKSHASRALAALRTQLRVGTVKEERP